MYTVYCLDYTFRCIYIRKISYAMPSLFAAGNLVCMMNYIRLKKVCGGGGVQTVRDENTKLVETYD